MSSVPQCQLQLSHEALGSIGPADPIRILTPAVSESIDAPTPIRSSGSFLPPSSPGPITYVDSPFSSRSVSIVGLLLPFSPIHAHSSLTFARCLFSHLRAAALAPRLAQPRLTPLSNHAARTQKRSQRCLFTRPPLPLPFLLFASILTLALPLPARSRVSVLSASKFEQIYLLLYLFGPKAHVRTAGADSLSVPLAAWVPLASASPSGSISDLADRLHIHDLRLLRTR